MLCLARRSREERLSEHWLASLHHRLQHDCGSGLVVRLAGWFVCCYRSNPAFSVGVASYHSRVFASARLWQGLCLSHRQLCRQADADTSKRLYHVFHIPDSASIVLPYWPSVLEGFRILTTRKDFKLQERTYSSSPHVGSVALLPYVTCEKIGISYFRSRHIANRQIYMLIRVEWL